MNIKEYIESGILEQYVAGTLSDEENEEVYNVLLEHPEVLNELLNIEEAIVRLTSSVAPDGNLYSFDDLVNRLNLNNSNYTEPQRTIDWYKYTGWAASILLAGGLLYTITQNIDLKEEIRSVETQKEFLEEQIEIANSNLEEAQQLVEILRDRNIISIPLAGQTVYPDAYAQVYWDQSNNTIYLDAQGLPEPPEGKVYQVWSLTLNPLTPTSLGIIEDFTTDDNKIFNISNPNQSEAFGITLEPAGGSESPTLEQLYTLGTVSSTP